MQIGSANIEIVMLVESDSPTGSDENVAKLPGNILGVTTKIIKFDKRIIGEVIILNSYV